MTPAGRDAGPVRDGVERRSLRIPSFGEARELYISALALVAIGAAVGYFIHSLF